jgi:2-phosphoglycerate kinase
VTQRDWHVLLVGGPSGTGKSAAVAPLIRRHGIGAGEIDDLMAAVRAMTTPEQQPMLHYWSTHAESREWTAEEIFELTLTTAEALAPAVEAVVASHLDAGPPVIMEGDYLLPALAGRLSSAAVRAVFLYEPDESQLIANYLDREPSAGPQPMRARISWLFGQWLATEAPRHGVAAIPARPWDTLGERIEAAIRPTR